MGCVCFFLSFFLYHSTRFPFSSPVVSILFAYSNSYLYLSVVQTTYAKTNLINKFVYCQFVLHLKVGLEFFFFFNNFSLFFTVLPTNDQVPIENVVVAESGDDSDDEWNYIQVSKSQKDTEEPHNDAEKEIEHEAADEEEEEDKENYKPVDDITSPTPPTASIGEVDIGQTEESHAISQAIAVETEELCSEVKNQNFEIKFIFSM